MVRFQLVNQSVTNIFSLNLETGAVAINSPLDREKRDSYWITVFAYDSGAPISQNSTSQISIKVLDTNDNPPQVDCFNKEFPNPCKRKDESGNYILEFEIEEEKSGGTYIGRINAMDSDLGENARIFYTIDKIEKYPAANSQNSFPTSVSHSEPPKFSIGSKTGEIISTGPIDREEIEKYLIMIKIIDNGYPALTATVSAIVNILSINDNSPVFNFPSLLNNTRTIRITHPPQGNSLVGKVEAFDKDVGEDGRISYHFKQTTIPYIQSLFRIDEMTGEIKFIRPLKPEDVRIFHLEIEAFDHGIPARMASESLRIIIEASALSAYSGQEHSTDYRNRYGDYNGGQKAGNHGMSNQANEKQSNSILDALDGGEFAPGVLRIFLVILILIMLLLTLVLVILFIRGHSLRKAGRIGRPPNNSHQPREAPKLLRGLFIHSIIFTLLEIKRKLPDYE